MPSPKSGKKPSPVAPAEPDLPVDADNADPGEMSEVKARQRQVQQGRYGAVQAKPHKPSQAEAGQQQKTSWIEIELVDEDNEPVPGEEYEITLPDDSLATGTLDEKGFARLEGIPSGTCQITFPALHETIWERA